MGKRGPAPAPRKRLHPDFLDAIHERTRRYELAEIASLRPASRFYTLTSGANLVPCTPVHIKALEIVASELRYYGALFVEDVPEAAPPTEDIAPQTAAEE